VLSISKFWLPCSWLFPLFPKGCLALLTVSRGYEPFCVKSMLTFTPVLSYCPHNWTSVIVYCWLSLPPSLPPSFSFLLLSSFLVDFWLECKLLVSCLFGRFNGFITSAKIVSSPSSLSSFIIVVTVGLFPWRVRLLLAFTCKQKHSPSSVKLISLAITLWLISKVNLSSSSQSKVPSPAKH